MGESKKIVRNVRFYKSGKGWIATRNFSGKGLSKGSTEFFQDGIRLKEEDSSLERVTWGEIPSEYKYAKDYLSDHHHYSLARIVKEGKNRIIVSFITLHKTGSISWAVGFCEW